MIHHHNRIFWQIRMMTPVYKFLFYTSVIYQNKQVANMVLPQGYEKASANFRRYRITLSGIVLHQHIFYYIKQKAQVVLPKTAPVEFPVGTNKVVPVVQKRQASPAYHPALLPGSFCYLHKSRSSSYTISFPQSGQYRLRPSLLHLRLLKSRELQWGHLHFNLHTPTPSNITAIPIQDTKAICIATPSSSIAIPPNNNPK